MRKAGVGVLALAGSLAFSLAMYSRLPDRVPVHWNVHNHVDRYGPRITLIVFPLVALVVFPVLARVLPKIDPRHANYEKHERTYWIVWNSIMVLLAAIEALAVGAALGWHSYTSLGVPLLIGMLFVVIGNVMSRVRSNWFVGIRTPWTLSSDVVWRKTHRLGARTFMLAGLLLIVAALIPGDWTKFGALVAAAVLAALVPIVYSYVAWRRIGRPGRAA
jgi:uncharacterized membrane protein